MRRGILRGETRGVVEAEGLICQELRGLSGQRMFGCGFLITEQEVGPQVGETKNANYYES